MSHRKTVFLGICLILFLLLEVFSALSVPLTDFIAKAQTNTYSDTIAPNNSYTSSLRFTVEGAKYVKQEVASSNFRTYEFDVYVQGTIGLSAAKIKITADAPGPSDPGIGVIGSDGKPLTKPIYPHRLSIFGATDTTQYVHSMPVDGDSSISTTATVDVYNDMWVTIAWFRYNSDPSGAVEVQLNFNVISTQASSPTPVPSTTSKTPTPSLAPTPTPQEVNANAVKIISIKGVAHFQLEGSNTWGEAFEGLTLLPGDKLRVENGYVTIGIKDSRMILKADSEFSEITVKEPDSFNSVSGVDLDSGSSYISSDGSSGITVQTPQGIITDLGTQFEIVVDNSSTLVRTYSGYVQVSDLQGKNMVFLGSGDTTTVPAGGKPIEPVSFDLNSVDDWWSILQVSPSPSIPEFPFDIIIGLISLLTFVVVCSLYFSKKIDFRKQSCQPQNLMME
jgi:hypothetical protein